MTIQEVDIAQRLNVPVRYVKHGDTIYRIAQIIRWYDSTITKSLKYSVMLEKNKRHSVQVDISDIEPIPGFEPIIQKNLKEIKK